MVERIAQWKSCMDEGQMSNARKQDCKNEEMEYNKVKLELKQEYQALNNHTLDVVTLHDACKQDK